MMWAVQEPDGVIKGWHGDGNYARASLMYALWKTRGTIAQPRRGRLILGHARHRTHMRLPIDHTRTNQFPGWFVVEAGASYLVSIDGGEPAETAGAGLISGLPLDLEPGQPRRIVVRRR